MIADLVRLVAPPASPIDNTGDWEGAEREVGLSFPADYRDLVSTFGVGTFGDFISVLSPFSTNWRRNIVERGGRWLEGQRELRDKWPEQFPVGLFPEPGGALPWGVTDNGDTCCWLVDVRADPSTWRLAIAESRGPSWHQHRGPIVEFLVDVLAGRNLPDFFPDDVPLPGSTSFRPVEP